MRRLLFCFVVVLFFVSFAQAQSNQVKKQPAQELPAKEAFGVLKELNDRQKLAPTFFDEPAEYTTLRPENCFGLILPSGIRLVGESSGKGYGLDYKSAGKWFVLIGFLYSEADFSVSNQPFAKGAYSIFAATDVLGISAGKLGDLKTISLDSKIDESLLKGGQGGSSLKRPRFSLTQEDKGIFLNVEGNKITVNIKPKTKTAP